MYILDDDQLEGKSYVALLRFWWLWSLFDSSYFSFSDGYDLTLSLSLTQIKMETQIYKVSKGSYLSPMAQIFLP